ncbi:MAG: ATP-binding cassette domain-containing protein [Culicoidibacterales bacterium]
MLAVEKMKVHYDKHCALNIDERITIEKGDRLAVIGTNGAGKSTFVKACLGITPYTGSIQTKLKPEDMAVHFQENAYSERVSIKILIETILNTNIKENEKLADLIHFFEFEPHLKKRFKQLSGGEKQRLTLILVLMQDTPLTFFDEVTSGLDFETRMNLMRKIYTYYENKDASIVLISHYYEEIEALANKILLLEKGEVVCYGEPKALFQKYCGRSVYVISKEQSENLDLSLFKRLEAPAHLIAISSYDEQEENQIAQYLIQNHVNFKRSEQDVELLAYNARRVFLMRKGVDMYV